MTQRVVVFLFLTGWAYLALALLRRDGWGAAGRAAQFALLAALTGALLAFWGRAEAAVRAYRRWSGAGDSPLWDLWLPAQVCGFFFLTTLGPAALYRRAQRLALRGRTGAAGWWERAARIATWDWAPAAEREVRRGRGWLRTGRAQEARDLLGRVLEEARGSGWRGAGLRRRAAALKAEAHVMLREWAQACGTFEGAFSLAEGDAPPSLLYAMVRAFLEEGRTDEGLTCLEHAEAQREPRAGGGPGAEQDRFMAFVWAFALTGQARLLRELMYDPRSPAWSMPEAMRPYWLGAAYAAAGDRDRARRCFEEAAALAGLPARQQAGDYDSGWREAISGRLEALGAACPRDSRRAGPQAAAAEAKGRAEALARQWGRRAPASPLTYGVEAAPLATALVLVNVAVWLLAEWWSRGAGVDAGDPRTLILFGANVPSWVRRGELWRLASGLFLHAGVLHLVFNMYALYLFGSFVERMAGAATLFVAYAASGLGASVGTAFLSSYDVSVGASGAVLGLLGAAGVLVLRRRLLPARLRWSYLLNFGFVGAASVLLGWVTPEVDNYAHLGGLCTGALLGFAAAPRAEQGAGRRWGARALAAALGVVFVLFGAEAGASVAGGGYPRRAGAMRRWDEAQWGLSLEVPRVWDRQEEGERVYFSNPLKEYYPYFRDVLEVTVRPATGGSGRQAASAGAEARWEEAASAPGAAPGGPVAVTTYRAAWGNRAVQMRFFCDKAALADRRELYRRIRSSVRPSEGVVR